jgi:Zn-dependent protease with chaperone function
VDFFAAQAQARQQSRLLGWGFAACLLAVVLALNAVVLFALRIGYATGDNPEPFEGSLTDWALVHPGTVFLTTLVVGGFIGCASFYRMLQLREGGGYVARSVGGVRVERSTQDPKRRMLHNIVDEMAIASGVPAPEVYVLEEESGINAFAAGHTPANAAIAVTRGCLQRLSRDQLQGIIGHEFSHVLNGDMRLSIRLMGLVFGLMVIALAGRFLLRIGARSDRGAMPALAIGMFIAVIGQIGLWGGRILQAWISRKRECLADASSVQFTRNPDGLKEALIRAAAMGVNRRFASTSMEQVAHMLFVSGGQRMLATHPPLLQRLQALDPSMTQPQIESMIRRVQSEWEKQKIDLQDSDESAEQTSAAPVDIAVPALAALIAATTGDPRSRHLDHAVALRHALPESLLGSAESPEHARSAILALMFCESQPAPESQLNRIAESLGQDVAKAVRQRLGDVWGLASILRLPAVLQLFSALRTLPSVERLALAQLLHDLARGDGKVSVFEYSLEKLISRGLQLQLEPRPPHGRASITDRDTELGVVFAVLARHGSRHEDDARRAYEAGIAPLLPRLRPAYAVMDDWVNAFDQALDRLCSLHPTAKQILIEGLVRTIAHDELLTTNEAELLRAICAVLECPLPPVLPLATASN